MLLIAFLFSAAVKASPTWTNTHVGGDDYLLGTIHMGDDRLIELPKQLKQLVDKIDILVVEVDLLAVSQAMITDTLNKYAILPKGQTLQHVLAAKTYNHLQRFCIEHGLSIQTLDRYQPWFVVLSLAQVIYAKQGFESDNGVDSLIISYAKSVNKQIIQLESFEQQIVLLQSLFGNSNKQSANELIEDTLEELTTHQYLPQKMLDAWFAADMEAFESIYNIMLTEDDFDKYYEQNLIINRNREWIKTLPNLLKKHSVLVAVGTMHFIGPHAIQKLLPGPFKQTN